MAKAGISMSFKPFQHRDPLTGETKTFVRDSHSRQSSMRLKNFQKCVRSKMDGQSFQGGTKEERVRRQRMAFAAAAKSCAGGRG